MKKVKKELENQLKALTNTLSALADEENAIKEEIRPYNKRLEKIFFKCLNLKDAINELKQSINSIESFMRTVNDELD